jgi:hypothetical protein
VQNPVFWSSVGFWILVVGLVGEAAVILFVHSGKLEKALSVICTVVIIAGVAVEHVADAKRFSSRTLAREQQAEMAATLKPFAGTPFDFAVQTDSEPIALMEQIAAALKSAGWIRKKWSGGGSDIVFNPPGDEPQAGIISSQGLAGC